MKKQFVSDLKVGETVNSTYSVQIVTSTQQENGFYRLNGNLIDKTDTIPFVRFDTEKVIIDLVTKNPICKVRGSVTKSKYNAREVRVTEFAEDKDFDPADYVQCSPIPYEDMLQELESLIQEVKDPDCARLLRFIFPVNPDPNNLINNVREAFLTYPAASGNHHAYRHGLLEHTLYVTKQARALALCSPEPKPNVDVVITAALLHDIGKVEEYTPATAGVAIGRTQKGNLMGHIVLGIILINYCIDALERKGQFDRNIADNILHCIASHHTKKEYGSPVEPMTAEAMYIARVDGLNAEQFMMESARVTSGGMRNIVKLGDRYYLSAPLERITENTLI